MLTEAQLSNRIIKHIKLRGSFAYKTSDRFQIGVPDIYMTGGNWIETKRVSCSLYFSPRLLLMPEQRNWAERLTRHGDKWWIVVGAVFPKGSAYYMSTWHEMKHQVRYFDSEPNLELCLSHLL